MSNEQFDMDKMVGAIRNATKEQLEWLMINKSEPDADISQTLVHNVMQTYLLTKIFEKLENIHTKLDMINCNITDVENAIDTLNPVYK